MIRGMKQRLLSVLCWLAGVMLWPAMVLAQDEAEKVDGRLEGFGKAVKVEPASQTLLWIVFVLLAAICVSVLFKDAKRSHLD